MANFIAFFFALASLVSPKEILEHSSIPTPHPLNRIAEDYTFSVNNQEPVNVGWLTIQLYDGTYAYIDITGSGNFQTQITNAAYLCSIHGQSFAINNPTWITIDAHTSVHCSWTTNVIAIDDMQTN